MFLVIESMIGMKSSFYGQSIITLMIAITFNLFLPCLPVELVVNQPSSIISTMLLFG
jgi:hypothetical protein